MWLKVGNTRVNLDNVATVTDRISNQLRYSTSDEGNLSYTFYTEAAEEFLELFNAYALVMDIETLRGRTRVQEVTDDGN